MGEQVYFFGLRSNGFGRIANIATLLAQNPDQKTIGIPIVPSLITIEL